MITKKEKQAVMNTDKIYWGEFGWGSRNGYK